MSSSARSGYFHATHLSFRSRLETAFQEDRKKLMGEKKELTKEVEALRKEVEAVRVKAKADLDEAKSKLIIERHEREKETSDHAVMLRELQKLLADERRAKEKLESALAEARNKEKAVVKAAEGSKVESRKMRDLEMKLRLTTEEADKAKKTLEKVQPELEKFSKELKDTKVWISSFICSMMSSAAVSRSFTKERWKRPREKLRPPSSEPLASESSKNNESTHWSPGTD